MSADEARQSMEAAKAGQSVQTIAPNSKSLEADMDKGEVNVVALNADGSHEFRQANAAEMQRMFALRSSDEEGFANRFNELHKGQFRMSEAGWVTENGVMREANDFEQRVVPHYIRTLARRAVYCRLRALFHGGGADGLSTL